MELYSHHMYATFFASTNIFNWGQRGKAHNTHTAFNPNIVVVHFTNVSRTLTVGRWHKVAASCVSDCNAYRSAGRRGESDNFIRIWVILNSLHNSSVYNQSHMPHPVMIGIHLPVILIATECTQLLSGFCGDQRWDAGDCIAYWYSI